MRIILIMIITMGLYLLQRHFYVRNCFKKLEAEVKFSTTSIFQGEEVILTVSVSNKKIMPIWWLGVKYNLSRNLRFQEMKDGYAGIDNYCRDTFFVMAYERITKKYNLFAVKRGYYSIKEIEINSGDLFNDTRLIKKLANNTELYVYPELISLKEIDIVFNKIYGEIIAQRSLLEDPFQLRGIREYSSFDSMKAVNWKASARSGELKVNQFENTSSAGVTIILNVEKYNSYDNMEVLERAISITASLATRFMKNGIEVEVISNGRSDISGEAISVQGGSNIKRSIEIYEALATLNVDKLERPLANLIDEEIRYMRKNRVIILVSHYHNSKTLEVFMTKLLQGYSLQWIIPEGETAVAQLKDIEEYIIRV
ncbi:DUF58 domain-containing protein [Clostridium thermarum]|uniref:DUF58 domain-containing protein n=1 Tax=Clostridium thermarum TaxID=1716543 RepID=UPI0013D10458|nr:DUF58 domain-containing protein [Clostridium thermarum]